MEDTEMAGHSCFVFDIDRCRSGYSSMLSNTSVGGGWRLRGKKCGLVSTVVEAEILSQPRL
jgi:hypothetical protein